MALTTTGSVDALATAGRRRLCAAVPVRVSPLSGRDRKSLHINKLQLPPPRQNLCQLGGSH